MLLFDRLSMITEANASAFTFYSVKMVQKDLSVAAGFIEHQCKVLFTLNFEHLQLNFTLDARYQVAIWIRFGNEIIHLPLLSSFRSYLN